MFELVFDDQNLPVGLVTNAEHEEVTGLKVIGQSVTRILPDFKKDARPGTCKDYGVVKQNNGFINACELF